MLYLLNRPFCEHEIRNLWNTNEREAGLKKEYRTNNEMTRASLNDTIQVKN